MSKSNTINTTNSKRETNITCKKCNYSWYTHSKLLYVSCPNCRLKQLNNNIANQYNKGE